MSSAGGTDITGIDGESSSGWSPKSRDADSRASSIEKDVNNINISSDQSNSTSAAQTPSGKVWGNIRDADLRNVRSKIQSIFF